MKKITLLLLLLLFAAGSYAQSVGINSDGSTPDGSAMLDVKSSNKGFLPPRNSDPASSISSPAGGLLVYKDDGTPNDPPGFYYFDGIAWTRLDDVWTKNAAGINYNSSDNVGIGTTTPSEKLDVNGVALSNFEGFSYYVTEYGVTHGAWVDLIINTPDYNTFSGTPYNTTAGTFTAPRTGYYRFTLTGYSTTGSNTPSDRYAFGIEVNGILKSMAGGNYSTSDTPLSTYTAVVYLTVGDEVNPAIFSSIPATLGGGTGHEFWFQGEFVGK